MSVTGFRLPKQKAFNTERVDALSRELTDITGLVFMVWDGDGRFWMPVGFSTTLTGLVAGSECLRTAMHRTVQATFDSGEVHREPMTDGLEFLAIPIRRRRRTAFVLAAVVQTTPEPAETVATWLGEQAGVPPGEVAQRLSGERCIGQAYVDTLARMAGRLGAETIQRLDAHEEVSDVSRKLAEGYEEITLYQRIASKVRVSQPSDAFFLATCSELLEFLDVDALAALYREKGANTELRVVPLGSMPLDDHRLVDLYQHFERDLADGREAVIANDCAASEDLRGLVPGVDNMILVPLCQGKKLYGIIAAFNKRNGVEFYSTDVKLVASISGTIAIFVENAHLYDDLQQLMLGTIRAMVSSIDAKDPYTCGHSERVAMIAKRIALQMGLPNEDVERIHLAGLLHDIGKIGVPERILLKKGRLEPDEFEEMKAHPTIGARILAGVRELEDVMPGVLHHHERLDGRGYPKGLDRTAMPLDSRIIGLADSLDAMTSNRVYRRALSAEKAEQEIRRCTGTQFDVRCVDALMEIGIAELLDTLPQPGEGGLLEVDTAGLRRT